MSDNAEKMDESEKDVDAIEKDEDDTPTFSPNELFEDMEDGDEMYVQNSLTFLNVHYFNENVFKKSFE